MKNNRYKAEVERYLKRGPVLIIFNEKCGDRYFLARNLEEFGRICIKIVKERKGLYYRIDKPQKPFYDLKDVGEMPLGKVRDAAINEIDDYNKKVKEFQDSERFFDLIKKKNWESCYQALCERRNYEYEGFILENPTIL